LVDLSGHTLSSLSLDNGSLSEDDGSLLSSPASGEGCFCGSNTGFVSTLVSTLVSKVDVCAVCGCCLL
jgi:hypothetical protein